MHIDAIILDESVTVNLDELCKICQIKKDLVNDLVNEGIIHPNNSDSKVKWQFSGIMVRRVQVATRLMDDLSINLAGAALAIDLMEELRALRQQLKLSE